MKTVFRIYDVLQIAEAIELKRARFYVQAALLFKTSRQNDLCHKLANRSAKYAKFWAQKRKQHSDETGEYSTFDPNDYIRSNPFMMAGLTWGGSLWGYTGKFSGGETAGQILKDAMRRSHELMIFYEGLKDFACDPATWAVIDTAISREVHYINSIEKLIKHIGEGNFVNHNRCTAF